MTKPSKSTTSRKKRPAQKADPLEKYRLMLMQLEQRIAFDAAAVATIEDLAHGPDGHSGHDGSGDDQGHMAIGDALAAQPVEAETQVVFVDTSVENYLDILKSISGDYEVVILDGSMDGMEQMAQVLKDMDNVSAIHVISHGSAGSLQLGSATLNLRPWPASMRTNSRACATR